ncbi:hypothetical protein KM043_004189 [Ampulex compressa]|nr:hypothetical protein KM043_004189 [Ampulex compressa]
MISRERNEEGNNKRSENGEICGISSNLGISGSLPSMIYNLVMQMIGVQRSTFRSTAQVVPWKGRYKTISFKKETGRVYRLRDNAKEDREASNSTVKKRRSISILPTLEENDVIDGPNRFVAGLVSEQFSAYYPSYQNL